MVTDDQMEELEELQQRLRDKGGDIEPFLEKYGQPDHEYGPIVPEDKVEEFIQDLKEVLGDTIPE